VTACKGDYIYYHYCQDLKTVNDEGWGCAYRSLQTLISWAMLQGAGNWNTLEKKYEIPTIPRIQEILVEIGDKQAYFAGSKEWIGAFEVSYVLNKVTDIESVVCHVSSGDAVVDKLDEFERHFREIGTPIMIGGNVKAYTMLGVAIDESKPEKSQFLILDPHYKSADKLDKILDTKKGGVWWKDMSLFSKNHFYNFCMPKPQVSQEVIHAAN